MTAEINEKFVKDKIKAQREKPGSVIPEGKDYVLFYDGGPKKVSGFGLRLTAAGVASFVMTYRFRGDSRRYTIGKYGPDSWTALAARQRAGELRKMIDSGIDPQKAKQEDREAPRMSDLFERYFAEHANIKKKPRSVADDWYLIHGSNSAEKPQRLEGIIGKHFGRTVVKDVTSEDVEQFHGSLHKTPVRANRAVALLSKIFNLAERWKLRPNNSNPCSHVERFKEKARELYLTPENLEGVGRALETLTDSPKEVAAIRLLLFTGMRVGELLELRWRDIDTKNGVARLVDAKAGGRDVQLPSAALEVIATLVQGEPDEKLLGLSYMAIYKAWARVRLAAGLPEIRIHDLRHTVGTYAGSAGFNAFLVKQLLGHKTLAMTNRYVGKFTDPLKEASGRVADQIAAAMKGKTAQVVPLQKREN